MTIDPVETLVMDLVEWLGNQRRPYHEVMDAWRTSCPRLPVWETAWERGLIDIRQATDGGVDVGLTATGQRMLGLHRQSIVTVGGHHG